MISHNEISASALWKLIKRREIYFAGNKKLKIFGVLKCKSGTRMKKENRVFFNSMKEAIEQGYRPCAHCMNDNYKKWKNEPVQ